MWVQVSQVVPGCVLLKDVMGKTGRPIIPKDTILSSEHKVVLQKFLVDKVNVSEKLENGKIFSPEQKEEESEVKETLPKEEHSVLPFHEHYQQVVLEYEQLFKAWQNNVPFDYAKVRKIIMPLIERMDDIGSSIYRLHHYTNKWNYFYHHGVSVAILSAYIGKKLGYPKGEWLQVGLAGFLSDAGMSKLGSIVFKEGKLTEYEYHEIKKHPTYSYRMLEKNALVSTKVKLAVLQHHERMDGSGYPLGIKAQQIHPYARIVMVCDIYHAMTSERLYREKQSPFKVIEELEKDQYSKLEPSIVQAFIQGLANFSIGTKVKLSNDRVGEIVFMDSKQPTRPMVRLEKGHDIIALSMNKDLYIKEVISN